MYKLKYDGESLRRYIEEIKEKGKSKYWIANKLGVKWPTVQRWYTEKTLGSPRRVEQLQNLMAEVCWEAKQKSRNPVDTDPFER